jgi:hypothetical protein
MLFFPLACFAQDIFEEVMVADFNTASQPNNIGGVFGTWDYDPNDDTQSCSMEFFPLNVPTIEEGFSLRLNYDVQSPQAAFNGFWMKLEGIDVSSYNRLRFWMRAAPDADCTARFKVELKNSFGRRAVYLVKDVKNEWQEVFIDFKKTRAIQDWTQLSELTIVFSDLISTYKEGSLCIDNISFVRVREESN